MQMRTIMIRLLISPVLDPRIVLSADSYPDHAIYLSVAPNIGEPYQFGLKRSVAEL